MLDLLNRAKGPVLEDYPIDLTVSDANAEVACPIDFTRSTTEHTSWSDRLSEELLLLLPWHELSTRRRKGRTLTNSSIDSKREAITIILRLNDRTSLCVLIECHRILEEAGLSELGRIVVPRYALELAAKK